MSGKIIIKNVKLVQDGEIKPAGIVIDGDRIAEITGPDESTGLPEYDGGGLYLSHGFIDIHLHGGGGADFMDGTEEAWRRAARLHLTHGATCITPTMLSATADEIISACQVFKKCREDIGDGARMLGIHLEGPYFSPEQAGAQDPSQLRNPDSREIAEILEKCEGIVRWSMAPELPGALETGRMLTERGIVAAIGHSNATYEEVKKSVEYGFSHITHLYSGCSSITRDHGFRRGGVVESAYLLFSLSSEIIADGCHLPAELLQTAYRFIGKERLCLITDAMRAAGQESGESILGSLSSGQKVIIEDGVAKMPDRQAFAGSVATADRLVRNMIKLAEVPLPDAIEMITVTPAKILGLSDVTGRVAPGRKADLCLFDDNINIKTVFTDGEIKYSV